MVSGFVQQEIRNVMGVEKLGISKRNVTWRIDNKGPTALTTISGITNHKTATANT